MNRTADEGTASVGRDGADGEERPQLEEKRVLQREDGRYVILYQFRDVPPAPESE